jgi:hypothetical protein
MKNPSPRGLLALLFLLVSWFFGSTSQAQVATYFTDKFGTFTGPGSYWYQEFTLTRQQTFVLRFTCDYSGDAAIVTGSQLDNFINNQSFSGYALFDNQFGTKAVTLGAGTYYLAARSQASGTNSYRLELDYDIALPAESGRTFSYVDNYIQGTEYVAANGGQLWHGFTIQSGFRYFVDGCNTGLSTYVIPASELSTFRARGPFNYYTSYSGTDTANPGFIEYNLPPGSYYLAFINDSAIQKPITYTLERWRINPITTASLDLVGPASWAVKNAKVDIRTAKVINPANSRKSGSLRLRLWAVRSRYTGGPLSGYVLGTRSLAPLAAGYQYTNIKGRVPYRKPPSGKYFTTITLEENTTSGWVVRDYLSFSGSQRF